jgi:hypothetical protein
MGSGHQRGDKMTGRRAAFALAIVLAVAGGFAPTAPAAAAHRPQAAMHMLPDAAGQPAAHPLTAADRELLRHGYLRRDGGAHLTQPHAWPIDRAAILGAAPTAARSWNGIFQTGLAPPDTTGAIGTTRYVELINIRYAIYGRSANTPIATGSLGQLTGDARPSGLTDPQVIWDATTGRFYYVVLNFFTDAFDVGFSKTASPNGAGDWCKYSLDYGYGSTLPDYPKLGDTADFLLIGANIFDANDNYLRADVNWLSKPPAGTTCPAATSFLSGQVQDMRTSGGLQTGTPLPANQIDTSHSGWIVAAQDGSTPSTTVSVFPVTQNADGTANIPTTGTTITVPSYTAPAAAPQSGTTHTLDTLDGRFTQAVAAVDPTAGRGIAVWTQQTVAGGAGSEVRWYEINPLAPALYQSGKATSATLWAFNAAISPDRAVRKAGSGFGADMVLGLSTTSTTTHPAIRMVSKVGANPESGLVLVKASPGPNIDFSCFASCRWGDYSGATPDPAAPLTGSTGVVWLANQWDALTSNGTGTDWRTWNWSAKP